MAISASLIEAAHANQLAIQRLKVVIVTSRRLETSPSLLRYIGQLTAISLKKSPHIFKVLRVVNKMILALLLHDKPRLCFV